MALMLPSLYPSPMLAFGCRYRAPSLKHLLTYTLLRHHHLPPTATTVTGRSSSFFFPNSLLFPTGNSKLSRMEVTCHLLWIYCAILAIFRWSYCSQLNDHIQPNTCLSGLDNGKSGIQLPVAPDVEAMKPEKYFWTGSNIDKNKGMVENMRKYGIIKSKKVAEVMETIDRALFVPDGAPPYVDSPMTIGYGATISAPHMHAMCLELLEDNLQPGMRVLDVGSGTGYLTACFAIMVGPQGRVIGVEHIPELVTSSIKNIERSAAAPLLKEGSLSLHVGDGREGWPEFAPYDAIHVGAAAPEIPQQLIDQLKPGGTMVIPVGNIFQDLKVVKKSKDGSVTVHTETSVRYVTLTSREAQLQRQ